jgi:protein TonB
VSNGVAASESGGGTRSKSNPAVQPANRSAVEASSYRPPGNSLGRDGFAARVFGLLGISVGTHMALLGVLGFMPAPAVMARSLVEMEIADPPPPPPPPPAPPPPAAEEPKPPEPSRPKLAPKPAAPKLTEPEPPKTEAKPASEAPVDLTGVTLTGNDGASWSSVVGNGEALHGPSSRIGRVTGNDRAGSNDGVVGGKGNAPALLSEAQLSRKPVPPDGMDALLEQNFPPRARAQGVSGSALLRVRILADGRVGEMQTIRETGDYNFGNACMKALRQRRWQPPLDRHGVPAATEIRYSCEFEVSY